MYISANDRIKKAWKQKAGVHLCPNHEFLLPLGRLNLSSLSDEKRTKILGNSGLIATEVVEIFEYGKNNDGYWGGTKLVQQVVHRALPIAEALYPGYSLLFLFDNATSLSVYADLKASETKWDGMLC